MAENGVVAVYDAVSSTEDALDEFMAENEALLAAADAFEPLRNAGGVVMEAFRDEPERLYGELLRLCRRVVEVCLRACLCSSVACVHGMQQGACTHTTGPARKRVRRRPCALQPGLLRLFRAAADCH